jgi:hypothetical protein
MKKNMALGDRILRMLAGIVLIIILIVQPFGQVLMYGIIALAFYLMTTSWIGHCEFYRMLNIDTRQFKEGDQVKH